MPLVLEAVDLAALLAEALAWALLTVLVILLAKLISAMHFNIDLGIVSFEPLGWLADALSSYVLTGAEEARQAVQGAMKATFDALVWSFDELLGIFTDLANATKGAFLYLWHTALHAFVTKLLKPALELAQKAEASVTALEHTVAKNLTKAEADAEAFGWKRLADAEGFTKKEVNAARADAAAALSKLTGALTAAEAGAIALPGQLGGDFADIWHDLKKELTPANLRDLLSLGVLGGLAVHSLATATGLDSSECQAKTKGICSTDPHKWASLLEGLALLGFAFDFRELAAFAEKLAGEGADLIRKAA